MKIEVITSICGAKDSLVCDQDWGGATWTAFLDNPQTVSTWIVKTAYNRFKDDRRNSRIHKILIHKYSDADVTIWIDGNIRLLVTPEHLVEKYLKDYDMALYKHGTRNCVYDEAMTCAKLKLDDIETIIEQAKYYEDKRWEKHKGLCEGGFIIRKNNDRTKAFNEAWWADYCRFSRRDQLSLMPALEKARVKVNIIDEKWIANSPSTAIRADGFVEIQSHLHNEGNWNQHENTI